MWKPVSSQQGVGNFTCFSNSVKKGETRKKFLLKPISGNENQTFFVAFRDKENDRYRYNPQLRTVGQGSFYFMFAKEDNREIFLISQTPIRLAVDGYHLIKRSKYDSYDSYD